jgi:TatD DNase family protein
VELADEIDLIDTHMHFALDYGYNFDIVEALINRAKEHNVGFAINIAEDSRLFPGAVALADRFVEVYTTLGLAPRLANSWRQQDLELLRSYLKRPKVVAVGEMGLDYGSNPSSKEKSSQLELLDCQLDLAVEHKLPIIITPPTPLADLLAVLRSKSLDKLDGAICNFAGNEPTIKELLEAGFYISYSSLLINSPKLQELARTVPLSNALLGTGCPHLLPPASKRLPYSEPASVIHTAKFLAKLMDLPLEQVSQATTENAKRLFKI